MLFKLIMMLNLLFSDFLSSSYPSIKYNGYFIGTLSASVFTGAAMKVFGLDSLALLLLLLVFVFELVTGILRATKQKEEITSRRFSRFTIKVCYYLIIIAVTSVMSDSFRLKDQQLASLTFEWMHTICTVHIVLENIISISENVAVISGKPKSHWINKIRDKVEATFFK